jgi:PEGA domain/Protein kinase domain
VFRTYEPTRDRLVAVKVFRLDVTPEQAQTLADELAHAAEAELFHPSIVEPIASGIEGTVAYRAEEYVAAESLDVAMRHYAPASFDTMMRIIGQLAEAIDVARRAGVGHGALHPRDIFVTPDEARASGFGVVDALERLGIRAPVRRPYSAPERIAGGDWSTRADVFSLGAIAFELLTGRRPSGTGEDIGPLTGAAVPGAERLQAVLVRAMQEDPSDRFGTGLELADALASAGALAAADGVTDARPVEPTTETAFAATAIPAEAHAFADEGDDVEEAPEQNAVTDGGVALQDSVRRDEEIEPWQSAPEQIAAAETVPPPYRPDTNDAARYSEIEPEPGAEARDFHAENRALGDDRTTSLDFSTLREPRSPQVEIDHDLDADEGATSDSYREDTRPGAFVPPSLFDGSSGAPPQVIERQVRPESAHHSDDHVPFDPFFAHAVQPERPRTAILPYAVILITGLLMGWGIAKFSEWRTQQTTVDSTEASGRPTAEPQGQPAGTRGTAADTSDRPVPPGTAATPSAPARESPPPRPAAPAPSVAARSGTLVVRSMPSGAAVTINGKWSGRTPLTPVTLPFGDYSVRVLLPGYQTRQEQVSLSADTTSRTLSVQLQREPVTSRAATPNAARPQQPAAPTAPATAPDAGVGTGTLEVDSRPIGARVFIDDRPVGTTPLRLPDVAPGSRVVRLELADHQTWTGVVQVGRGKTTRVAGSLEPIR